MRYPFLDLAKTQAGYVDELKAAANAVIESGRFLHGPQTEQLEQEIATLCQVKHCVTVSNGLDALRLILRAYIELGRLQPGDKVIVPANTYIASVLAITDNGLIPILCDIRPDTMNLDASLIDGLMDSRVKAVMPVHLYGTPCCDKALLDAVAGHNLLMIEDNAQAIGAMAAGTGLNGTRMTGGLGHAAGISFYPTKNLGALGDGGAVTTNDDELALTVHALANYGSDRRYHNIYCGLNCRLDEIQAAMLRVKLHHFQQENAVRREVAATYAECITHRLVVTPTIFGGMEQVWHQFVIRVTGGQRDAMRAYLKEQGIGTDIHYATPPHLQPCYRDLTHGPLPITEQLADEIVSLPIAAPITPAAAQEIAVIINRQG